MQIDEYAQILLAKVAAHLIEDRGFASAPLAIDNDHIIPVLAAKRALDESEHILAAKEHFSSSDWATSNIWVRSLRHSCTHSNHPNPSAPLSRPAIANRFLGSLAQLIIS